MIDIQNKIEVARSKANSRGMAAFERLQDDQRFAFLDRLHVAAQPATTRAVDGSQVIKLPKIRLSEWEQHFVADLVSERRELTFSQRAKIDELRQRHQSRL